MGVESGGRGRGRGEGEIEKDDGGPGKTWAKGLLGKGDVYMEPVTWVIWLTCVFGLGGKSSSPST